MKDWTFDFTIAQRHSSIRWIMHLTLFSHRYIFAVSCTSGSIVLSYSASLYSEQAGGASFTQVL